MILSKVTGFKYYLSITKLTLLAFFTIATTSCDDDDQAPVIANEISSEIKDIIYFLGNERAPTVLINVQGGPNNTISKEEVAFIAEKYDTAEILTVTVHQVQTLNPSILNGNDITLDQAVNFNAESIEMLNQVIKYFKNEGRTVYVLGNSFGAFVAQDLIAKKGIDVADKYLIMTGRLDMNDVIWQALVEGRYGEFENGVTPIISPEPAEELIERNFARIMAGFGKNRYTQLLNSIGDLSSVTYIYGKTDQFVGSLTDEEVQFLKSKNAQVIGGSGDHDLPFDNFFEVGLNEAFGIR